MRESHEDEIRKDIILTKQNKSIQSNQSNQLENNYKTNVSFYMRKNIADLGREYAHRSGMTVGDFVEQSLVLFMDLNPIQELFYAIEQPTKIDTGLEETMLEIICIGELEEWLEKIQPFIQQRRPIHKSRIKEVYEIIKRCKKINNPSKRLEQLIQEAAKHVTESNI